jgi:hypothetical protein
MGIDVNAMNMGIYLKSVCGILYGMCVSLYHVSACMFGDQHIACDFGPKAIHLATSHAQILADKTNSILIMTLLM